MPPAPVIQRMRRPPAQATLQLSSMRRGGCTSPCALRAAPPLVDRPVVTLTWLPTCLCRCCMPCAHPPHARLAAIVMPLHSAYTPRTPNTAATATARAHVCWSRVRLTPRHALLPLSAAVPLCPPWHRLRARNLQCALAGGGEKLLLSVTACMSRGGALRWRFTSPSTPLVDEFPSEVRQIHTQLQRKRSRSHGH